MAVAGCIRIQDGEADGNRDRSYFIAALGQG